LDASRAPRTSEERAIGRVVGTALPLRGNDIDTDRIIPARFLKSITFEGLGEHLFEDERREASSRGEIHPLDDGRFRGASILLVDANFGCGSSREHAPQAIYRRGIRAIVGESFSEIFFGNSVALGMPCVRASADTIQFLMANAEQHAETLLTLDIDAMNVSLGGRAFAISLPPAARRAFLSGSWDATGALLEHPDEVRAVIARLPYINAFR
jgi:3-isopropylmalate/(R)-2-methylmalate dehydratase small subunit